MARMRRRAKGYGHAFEKAPGRWAIRWSDNGQKRSRFGFRSKAEAELELDRIRVRNADGLAVAPTAVLGVQTVEEFASGFLERRKATHRAGAEDGYRWKGHLGPFFGRYRPEQVNSALIRRYLEEKLQDGANPATLRVHIALLSSLYEDLIEKEIVRENPARGLPRSVRAMMRPRHRPEDVPFIENPQDIGRIYRALEPPYNIGYAIGAMAGLRTGEVFGLRWRNVDLQGRRIHVRESWKRQPTKDKQNRVVPIMAGLFTVLAAWKATTGAKPDELVCPSRKRGGKGGVINRKTMGPILKAALEELHLYRDGLDWYGATRHSFASQYVLAGGSIEKLSVLLGHYSVTMTERYAHLRTDLFSDRDLNLIDVDLARGPAKLSRVPTQSSMNVE